MDFAFGTCPWSHLRSSLSNIFHCVYELAVKRTEGLLGFTHFHCHKDVVDLDPGSPYEDLSFFHGGIHAGVRMCEIVACGWGDGGPREPLGKTLMGGIGGEGGESDKVPYYHNLPVVSNPWEHAICIGLGYRLPQPPSRRGARPELKVFGFFGPQG